MIDPLPREAMDGLQTLSRAPGARPALVTPRLVADWRNPKLRFEIRLMVLTIDQLYREQGAIRARVLRLLDGPATYAAGLSADISVLELPGVKKAEVGDRHWLADWITKRMNRLFPSAESKVESAVYDGAKIALHVSMSGWNSGCCVLGEWFDVGATGRILTPRKLKE